MGSEMCIRDRGMAFTSFVIPVIPAVVAIVVGATTKRRLRAGGGNRTNEGLASLAQLSALFTLALHGGFALWVALS